MTHHSQRKEREENKNFSPGPQTLTAEPSHAGMAAEKPIPSPNATASTATREDEK